MQPAGDEIKYEGSSLLCLTYAGRLGSLCWAQCPAGSLKARLSQGGQGFHTAGPSDQASVGKGRNLGQEAAQLLLRV